MPSDIFDEIEATPETTTDIFDQIAPSPELLKERPAFEEPIEPPEITAKRAGLTSEMQQARIAGKLGRAELAARKGVETGAQILSGIFPTTAISRAAQAIGLRPIVPPEHVKQVREGVTAAIDTIIPRAQVPEDAPRVIPPELGEKINKGLTEFGDETLSSFTSPEQVALLASGAPAPQVVGRLFQIGSITSVPEAIEGLKEAVKTGDAKQITKAGAGLGMTLAIPAAIEKGLAPKPAPPIPPVTGRILRPPAERGVVTAIGPEVLPPPGIEVPPPTPSPAPTPAPRAIPSLPAVEPGFVRVFSGTRFPGSKSSWFSTNVKRAGEFAGDRGEVNYVDVPKEEFDAAAERAKEGGSFTPGDALLSNKWVNQAKSLREELIKRARPQAKPTTATDLEPALLVNDVPVAGGWDHEAIFKSKNTPELPVEEKMSLVEAYANDKQHIFVNKNTGERYTREQAAKILGEKDPLDSARLRELQGIPKPETKAKAPPALTTVDAVSSVVEQYGKDKTEAAFSRYMKDRYGQDVGTMKDAQKATSFALFAKDVIAKEPKALASFEAPTPPAPKPKPFVAKTEGATTTYNEAKTGNDFKISTKDGSNITGYVDGEIFYVEVKDKGKGTGTSLFKDALRLLASKGNKTVTMRIASTPGGRAIVAKMVKEGYVSEPIATKPTGSTVHNLLIDENGKRVPTPATAAKEPWQMTAVEARRTFPTLTQEKWDAAVTAAWKDGRLTEDSAPVQSMMRSKPRDFGEIDAVLNGRMQPSDELLKRHPELAPKPSAPAAETVPIPPRVLPGAGINSKDVARQYGLPEDFYGTGDEQGVLSSKYRTKEYDAAIEAEKRTRNIQGINGPTIRRQARERVDAEFKKIVGAVRSASAAEMGRVSAPLVQRLTPNRPTEPETKPAPPTAPAPSIQASGEVPPIGQGPGGMTRRVSARPEPPPETLEATGLKHAIDELERLSYGFAARTLPEKQAMAAAWQRAGALLAQDADAGRRLTQALVLNPKRGLSADESALILRHKVGLENAVNDAAERTLTTTGDAKVEANAQLDRSRAELNDLLDAVAARGTEWGREGRWRQALAYEDYSFATQERLLSAAKGRPLTDAERIELQQQLADYKAKFDALEKSQSEREQRAVDIAVKEALDKVEKEAAAAPKYGSRVLQVAENFAKYMDAKGDAALQRLRERASRMSAGVDPAIVSDLAIWGASKATRGVVEFAKWSDMAITELGEWVRPHLEAAWEASKKLLDGELTVLEKKVGKPTTTAVKKKISERTTEENIADLTDKISTTLEENDLSAVAPLVRKLARFYVESGVRGRDNLINSVHAVLQDIVPGITRSDTMRAIAGYGDYKLLPKDAVSIILRGYKGEMQQIAKLEDMAAGIAPAKTGIERRTPTEEERALIKQVEEAKKKGGYAVTDPETQLRTAMDAVKRRLENQIADLEKQISTREKIVKDPTRLEYDAEANQLKARRDELKKEFDEIFPKQPMTEAERLAKWKDRTQKRIAEIQEMIRSGDIEIKPPKPPVALDVEGRRLQAALAESKENLKHAREKAEWEKMSVFQKARRGAVDSYDAARMLMTTGEFSFVLRQGKWTFLSRPLTTIRALPGMFQAMRNWRTAHEVDLKIFNDPEYPAAKAAKLHLIDESASLTRQEEIYAGRWAHAIPVVAHFNRAARVFLNKIRFDTWKAMRKSVGRDGVTTPAEDLAIATFVNESTGRGGLGFAEQAAVPMGRAFFAPRYTISRFQLLAGHSLWKGSVRSRRVIATEYARALIGLGIYYSLLNAYFAGSKDKRRISLDPRSADFGKVRLGNTRLDPLAGVQQAAVFIGRTATGETVTQKGKTISIRRAENVKPRYGDPTWTDIAARFARSKMHPVPSAIANLFSGTTMDGRATSFVKETGNLVGPITYFDIYSALNEQDIPDAMALSLLAVLGEGLQTYKPKK